MSINTNRWKKGLAVVTLCSCMVLLGGCGKAESSYKTGMEQAESGNYKEAEKSLKNAIDKNKEKAEYFIAYGLVLNNVGKYEKAIKNFDLAYQDVKNSISNTNNKQVFYGKAIAYYNLGDYDQSLSFCQKALELSKLPEMNKRIYATLGDVYRVKGNTNKALENYNKALKADKQMWSVYAGLYQVYVVKNEQEQAQKVLEKLLSQKTKSNEINFYLGNMYFASKNYEDACKYYETYVSKAKNLTSALVYNQMAGCAIENGDYSKAEQYLSAGKAVNDPSSKKVLWKNEIILLERQKKWTMARKEVKLYLNAYKDDTEMKKERTFIKTRIAEKR